MFSPLHSLYVCAALQNIFHTKSRVINVLQRKSKIESGSSSTSAGKVATPATNSTSLSRFAFRGGQNTNKRKLVQLESSDEEEGVDIDWENVEADRLQEDMMGEFVSGDSDESSEAEDYEEVDEEARRREREQSLLEAVGAFESFGTLLIPLILYYCNFKQAGKCIDCVFAPAWSDHSLPTVQESIFQNEDGKKRGLQQRVSHEAEEAVGWLVPKQTLPH